ncbi:acyltransferase-domain-containing protein [Polychytrium aggregatum]|uniref:acyltransferase-domain-containing protein n=1 Tax=Polychytrium aggregatum TaxID=110093 RepID=UPI0022FE2B1A|nr:acyltransferase-domain-containing protein [Polychytrium aggregatum]KAI9207000.1 acyltransferase-domain-containing protein [Polychytrium aggregatum]
MPVATPRFYVALVVFAVLNLWIATSVLLSGTLALVLLFHSHRAYREFIQILEKGFGSHVVILTYLLSPADLLLTGDLDALTPRTRSIIMANHQIYPDWLYLWSLAWWAGIHGTIKIILMEPLKYIPIVGMGMQLFEFIFMKRKWALDRDNMSKILRTAKADNLPLSLLIFPEGTLNTPNNKATSEAYAKKMDLSEKPEFVLLPKSTGLHFSCETLLPEITTLVDVTVGYSGLTKDQVAYDEYLVENVFFHGKGPKQVHMHIRKFDIRTLPGFAPATDGISQSKEGSATDGDQDEGTRQKEEFNVWLRKEFMYKDSLMGQFYSTGKFADNPKRVSIVPTIQDWVSVGIMFLSVFYTFPLLLWLARIPLYLLFGI